MAIEGFDYQGFAQELASQANELLPANFQEFQKQYVVNTIKNFATLCGEAIYNDETLHFTAEQGMLITQIIAEWSFHKSVDIIKAGIIPEYWDGVMQKIAFTIFEIAKQAISKNVPQDEVLQIVEHHVKKAYEEVINELKKRNVIDDRTLDRALHQSNIDDMMEKLQEEKAQIEAQNPQNPSQIDYKDNSKILKLASVALLLKQVSQDKVQTILNKFDAHDKQTIIQYMQMSDLESKVDKNIAMKCLNEIRTSLPEPRFINPDKILGKMTKILAMIPKEKVRNIIAQERPFVKDFIEKSIEGEYSHVPSKVANIIAQHLEDKIS